MRLSNLRTDLRLALMNSSEAFDDSTLDRILTTAAEAMAQKRPLIGQDTLTVAAGTELYTAPAGVLQVLGDSWSDRDIEDCPWNYPFTLPSITHQHDPDDVGAFVWRITPIPTAEHLYVLGPMLTVRFNQPHSVSDTLGETTLRPADRELLLLRAVAECAKYLAVRQTSKAMDVRPGMGANVPRNSTPLAVFDTLMKHWSAA